MKRDDLTEKILDTKRVSGMSWEDIAEKKAAARRS